MKQRQKFVTYYSSRSPRHTEPKKRPKHKHLAVFLAIIIALSFVGFRVFSDNGSSNAREKVAKPSYSIDESRLGEGINQALAGVPADIQTSVAVVDLTNQKLYTYGTQAPFDSASVAKIVTATLFLHGVEQGNYKLTDQIAGKSAREQLRLMIVESDNNAWKALNDELTHEKLDNWAHQNGMSSYSSDENQMTTADMARLLQKFYKKELLNEQNTNILLNWMKISKNSLISEYVPQGTTVYRKAGWLDDRYHEATIVDNGSHPYVLIIFTKSAGVYPKETGRIFYKKVVETTTEIFK